MSMQSAQRVPAERATTDIFHEAISAQGLQPAYCVTGWPRADGDKILRNVELEILLPLKRAEAFKVEADRIGETNALDRTLCELVHDEGGASWCLVEVMAPRALACELIVLAQAMGCERRPFPM